MLLLAFAVGMSWLVGGGEGAVRSRKILQIEQNVFAKCSSLFAIYYSKYCCNYPVNSKVTNSNTFSLKVTNK